MSFRIDITGSELFELLYPAVVIASAIISTWVLVSARKRFSIYLAFLWAIATFLLPLVILPVYLLTILIRRPRFHYSLLRSLIIPVVYLGIILAGFATYSYLDRRTVDAHLSRAAFAKVRSDMPRAIQEYRTVLKMEDSAHNHKLLAEALSDAGSDAEAIDEFRVAESKGEPDDSIHFRLAILLERVDRRDDALIEFRKFLMTQSCQQVDERCEAARERLRASEKS